MQPVEQVGLPELAILILAHSPSVKVPLIIIDPGTEADSTRGTVDDSLDWRACAGVYLIASALAQFDRNGLAMWEVLLRLVLAALVMVSDPWCCHHCISCVDSTAFLFKPKSGFGI